MELESGRPRVLHVTSAWGAGVQTALIEYARQGRGYEHHLVHSLDNEFLIDSELDGVFASRVAAPSGYSSLVRTARREIRQVNPDVLHLHSAVAGGLGRIFLAGGRARPAIVYSPHAYLFERAYLARPVRSGVRACEMLLARRTDLTVGVSPYEVRLAESLGSKARYVPNIVTDAPQEARWLGAEAGNSEGLPQITTIGRLMPQKDPDFFLATIEEARKEGLQARWTWIGTGNEQDVGRLRTAGVEVTGWLSRAKTFEILCRSACYVHTAAWEGSPMSILEAATVGVPIVARSIPAIVSLGMPDRFSTPASLARGVIDVVSGRRIPTPPRVGDQNDQARALRLAYTEAVRQVEIRQTRAKSYGRHVGMDLDESK
ncbi:glycosyltransferase involved in cell wall biosynthesis [Geodermatophilus daqingensis]|uniref:Glycosyltransferase involved in cell wall biosynthesis n=1 Tax=Petropleomorpha daqingensis TaxID=2026353 RepID=A0A853CHW0_9ACTN|nr:glycosyltransferase involved in cell wall biosynthesis [Petropleomorpha daqingensis]